MLRQTRERGHPVARDRGHAVVEAVLVALVGEGPDQPDLAAHVAALDEQRRADDEDVDPLRAGDLGGLAVDPAVDVDLAAVGLVAQDLARGAAASRPTSVMNVWPPNPGSTVMTRTMSSSSAYGSSAASGVPGLTARPAARPAARIALERRRDRLLDLDVERDRVAAGVDVLVQVAARLADHQVGVERQLGPRPEALDRSSAPNVRFGTKWPSMTSRWIRSAPASATRRTA